MNRQESIQDHEVNVETNLDNVILYNSSIASYAWLSNFHEYQFFCYNRSWSTVEHCFQAMKFVSETYAEEVRQAPTPHLAKKMGRSRQFAIHNNWDELRIDVMRTAIASKFVKGSHLTAKLIDTYPKHLAELSRFDRFWGCNKDLNGKNMHGKLLMELRECLL